MTKAHDELKEKAAAWLRNQGYWTQSEYSITNGRYRVDVIGQKPGKRVAVECGTFRQSKLDALLGYFDAVWVWPYNKSQPHKYVGLTTKDGVGWQ